MFLIIAGHTRSPPGGLKKQVHPCCWKVAANSFGQDTMISPRIFLLKDAIVPFIDLLEFVREKFDSLGVSSSRPRKVNAIYRFVMLSREMKKIRKSGVVWYPRVEIDDTSFAACACRICKHCRKAE